MKIRMLILLLSAALCAASAGAQPKITAPESVLHDEPFIVTVSGLKPGGDYTLRWEFYSRSGTIWRSEAMYAADPKGEINTAATAPISGSFTGTDPLAPFWSMVNAREKTPEASLADDDDRSPVLIDLREGDKSLAQHIMPVQFRALGVSTVEMKGPVTGTYFTSPGAGRKTTVIVLGGSEGGIPRSTAALVASHGVNALALGYFGVADLPRDLERVTVETIDRAVEWLAKQPGVDARRIVVMGASKGAELALLAAAHNSKIRGVIGSAPSSLVYEAISQSKESYSSWTIGGKDVPFAPYVSSDKYKQSRRLIDLYDPTYDKSPRDARIPVEKISGPILLISGKEDALWPSSRMADEIATRLANANFKYRVENLKFDNAGHHAGSYPMRPTADSVRLGGTAEGIARAQVEAWRAIVAFLKKLG